jgi:hypothetical protein
VDDYDLEERKSLEGNLGSDDENPKKEQREVLASLASLAVGQKKN